MKEIIFWTLTIGAQILIYLLPSISLPKGKWIRKKDTASTSLSIAVESEALRAKSNKKALT